MKITVDEQGNVDPPGSLVPTNDRTGYASSPPGSVEPPESRMYRCPRCRNIFNVYEGKSNEFHHDCPP